MTLKIYNGQFHPYGIYLDEKNPSEYNGLFGISHPDLIYLYSVTLKFDPELLEVEYVVFYLLDLTEIYVMLIIMH